jgi:anti-sigma B factor antagonist
MALTYTVSRSGDVACLALAGELDLSVQEQVRGALARLLGQDAPRRLEIDMSGLEFIDSSSIGCWSALAKAPARPAVTW